MLRVQYADANNNYRINNRKDGSLPSFLYKEPSSLIYISDLGTAFIKR